MGHKKLCLECRKAFNRDFDPGSGHVNICPDCGKEMILMPHRFRPPKRTDDRKWETVRFFIEHGFKYQHIYKYTELNGRLILENVEYPESLKEAREFVLTYKNQSYKK